MRWKQEDCFADPVTFRAKRVVRISEGTAPVYCLNTVSFASQQVIYINSNRTVLE